MHYRSLGRTGLEISELSWGAARGMDDPDTFLATAAAAFDAGINFVDTAQRYGDSERVLGQALRGHDEVIVETKYLPYDSFAPDAEYTGNAQQLTASVEGSLQRLGRDHIDILLGHGMRTVETYDRFMADGCYDAMVRLRDQGKVRFIGISELSEADGTHSVLRHAVPSGNWDVVMLTVNFLLQTAVETVLPLCREHDTGTVVMMPLNQASAASGLVSLEAARECVRRHIKEGNLPAAPPFTDPELFAFLEPYPIREAALRYVLAQAVSSCCVGASRPERITQNIRACAPPYLDAGRLTRLQELFAGIDQQVR
jgi:aryl-alcohol dehydrogenase-like predicted oxidoreductase